LTRPEQGEVKAQNIEKEVAKGAHDARTSTLRRYRRLLSRRQHVEKLREIRAISVSGGQGAEPTGQSGAGQLVRACDLILFTTVASTPHIVDPALFEHNPVVLHISLRDLAPELLLKSQNVVDDVEHVMKANTSPHLAEQQTGNRSFVTGTLAEIMTGCRSVNRRRPIIFSPFGMGILDLAVGKWIYDQAVAAGQDLRLSDFFHEVVR